MTNAIAQIMTNLDEVFVPMDAEVLARSLVWIEERAAAVREFERAEDMKPRFESMRFKNNSRFYEMAFAIAGGKTWYRVVKDRNAAGRADFVTKNCKAIADKRNAMIARKLEKAGVNAVVSSLYSHSFTRTADGFDGCFVLETNAGRKVATINTIHAGGYNIQCAHLRVLVKVK